MLSSAAPARAAGGASAPGTPLPAAIPAVEAEVTVSDFGTFRIAFDREGAPNHVAAFLSLAAAGEYDGLGFHRVIPGYLIQTGDPTSRDEDPWNDGHTLPPWRIPAERTEATHVRGTVSMAWLGDDPGSAGAQWFVTLSDLPQLDGHATPIGTVVEGMDVVEGISQVTTLRNRNPYHPVRVESVRLVAPAGERETTPDANPGG
jgi:cyclophilin family peptidyl-prolyl cis-trans isomerase